jgi:hypothetical protein
MPTMAFVAPMVPVSTTRSPFSVLVNLVKRNPKKLTDAHEVFEVISNRMGMLDSPQELVAFLGQHLKPKELEKKQNGEVFTPPSLIQEKFDKLTLADPNIWSDPTRKFLDPANGIGNYPAMAYQRLMEGLKVAIPNVAERKEHILKNMLYMCELNAKNVEVSRKLFDPEGVYELNLYQGSFLDLNPEEVWKVKKFDVVFGNPPYQPPSNGKKGGKSLWPLFVKKSLELLKKNGFLVFVHPALWRKPENELHDLMFEKQFHYLSIHSSQDGVKTFQAGTRYDWYVLQNTKSTKPTPVRFDDGIQSSFIITPSLPFIVNHGGDIMNKVVAKNQFGYLKAERCHTWDTRRDYVNSTKTSKYVYPLINGSSKTRGIRLSYSSIPMTYQYTKKIIFSNGGEIQPFYDSGKFGTTEAGIFIPVESDADGIRITRFLKSKLVSYIVGATKWSNFETTKQIFWSIPNPKDLPDNFTDEQVYSYFGLVPEEISRIEANPHRPGLTNYVPLEPPAVSVPPPPAQVTEPTAQPVTVATAQPDYKMMKVVELKQLCKDRKLKGITGKSKEELIAMLNG